MGKVTSRTALVTLADADVLHVVDVSDTTDSPQGTSKKATAQLFREYLGNNYVTAWQSSTSKTLNSTPLDVTELPAPGAGKISVPRFIIFAIDAGTAYDFPVGGVNLIYSGFTDTIVNISQTAINSASDLYAIYKVQDTSKLKVNTKMQLYSSADATVGTGTYYFRVVYSIETAPF